MEHTGGELIVDSLRTAGVDTLFGIISVHNIPIFDALAREGGMRLVPARTEHGAALMAAVGPMAVPFTGSAGLVPKRAVESA